MDAQSLVSLLAGKTPLPRVAALLVIVAFWWQVRRFLAESQELRRQRPSLRLRERILEQAACFFLLIVVIASTLTALHLVETSKSAAPEPTQELRIGR